MTRNRIGIGLVLCGALLLFGCSKKSQTATVTLKDGTTFTGTVTKSDTSGYTLTSSSGETRTYPMAQVAGIQYSDAGAEGATGSTGSETASTPTPAAPAPIPERTIPANTQISVRNSDRIQAGVAEAGQEFPGVIVGDVIGTDGGIAIPKGSDAMLVVRQSVGQGKLKGQSELVLDVGSVTVGGRKYTLETSNVVEKGKQGLGKNKRSGEFVGGGAVLGTIIGAVAGGGKGAAIGAAAGAGAGVGAQAVTRGKAISIPSETVLSFQLEDPVSIRLAQ